MRKERNEVTVLKPRGMLNPRGEHTTPVRDFCVLFFDHHCQLFKYFKLKKKNY